VAKKIVLIKTTAKAGALPETGRSQVVYEKDEPA